MHLHSASITTNNSEIASTNDDATRTWAKNFLPNKTTDRHLPSAHPCFQQRRNHHMVPNLQKSNALKITKPGFNFKRAGKILLFTLISIVGLLILTISIIYFKKDAIIAKALSEANKGYKGLILVDKTDITPFKNFPYISFKIQGLKIYESKASDTLAILQAKEAYIGFNLWRMINKDYSIKKIALSNGAINIVQYQNQEYNIVRAFTPIETAIDTSNQPFTIDLQGIHIDNMVINKNNLSTNVLIQANIKVAEAKFKKTQNAIKLKLDGDCVLDVINDGKPTYVYRKNIQLRTNLVYNTILQSVEITKSSVYLEGAEIEMNGRLDITDDLPVDLEFSGKKQDFNLLIAFAPESLIPTLRSYDNKGDIYFNATIKGKTANNQTPAIEANFGCKNGYIKNRDANKVLDKLGFHCTFTNGPKQSAASSTFELKEFSGRPEAGKFNATLSVKNFEAPEIDMRLDSDFDLVFLTKFFRLKDLTNLSGQVLLTMNFHDIIDLEHPERALEKLNQAYYSKLEIKNLNFKSDSYHLPLKDLNVEASVTGENLALKNCSLMLGENDLAINGRISNIPAVIHKASEVVNAELHIKSKKLDISQLKPKTNHPSSIDEVISNLSCDLSFKGKANTFITSKSLPIGNYYITNISGKLKNYFHKINGLNAVFYINDKDVLIKRADGKIDGSDFHLEGKIGHYDLWLADNKTGSISAELNLTSKDIYFKDVFTYKGENYVPKEYRSEHLESLRLQGKAAIRYIDNHIKSADIHLTEFKGQLRIHPLKLYGLKGNIHLEDNLLNIKNISGNLGNNDFKINGTYAVKNQTSAHQLTIECNRLNVNEIITYNAPPSDGQVNHAKGTNVFEAPFPNVSVNAKINDLTYQSFRLQNVVGQVRVKTNHVVHLDKVQFKTADGLVEASGYFDGSNPKRIYMRPNLKLQKVDLDKVLLKFDNFGQDQLVSDNLHGIITSKISGVIQLHSDFTPMINHSDLQIDVSIDDGRLDSFAPMRALSSYFDNKNLNRVKFDKLENRFTLKNGKLSFPNMTINSSLGYIEISGSQTVDMNMDYYIRVPLKLAGRAVFSKLFKRKPKEISPDQEDELIVKDVKRRTRFINIRLSGTPQDYKISLQKNKALKAGEAFKKTEDFMFDDIESEFDNN
ncbi:MAG: DUF3971 domain-containing protein [Bacteroidetes bacterium]|nr:MAG: DUF3971 domain-containing protein [Bacteroidota bacterium]